MEKKLSETLSYKKKSVYEAADADRISAAMAYSEDYKKYLDSSKTEREAVKTSIALAEKFGYTEYSLGDKISAGDKKYYKYHDEWTVLSEEDENKNKNISLKTYADYKNKVYNQTPQQNEKAHLI